MTVVYFWGSWCLPCREYSPLVSELAKKYADAPVDVFGVAIRERDLAKPRDIMTEHEYAHRLVLNNDGLATAFRVRAYPTIYVIGPDGAMLPVEQHKSGQTAEDVMKRVNESVGTLVQLIEHND